MQKTILAVLAGACLAGTTHAEDKVPAGVTPDMPEYWAGGRARCTGKIYEYEDGFGCGIEGDPAIEVMFDGNGRLERLSHFKKFGDTSKLDGAFIEILPNGVRSQSTYKRGVADGPLVETFPDGKPSLTGNIVADKYDGTFVAVDGTGKELARYQMRAGTGTLRRWHANGARASETGYRDGKLHGASLAWFADGKPHSEAHYDAGERTGVAKTWSATGVLELEGTYVHDAKHGTWTHRDAANRIVHVETYDDGSLFAIAAYRDGKRLGTAPSFGACTSRKGIEKEAARRVSSSRDLCAKEATHFPGVAVLGAFGHDRGCAAATAYIDCSFKSPASTAAIMARAGWAAATPAQRAELAGSYVAEIELAWDRAGEPTVAARPDGSFEVTVDVTEPVGMVQRPPATHQLVFVVSSSGQVRRR